MKKKNLLLNTANSMTVLLIAVFGLLFPMGLKAEPTEDCDDPIPPTATTPQTFCSNATVSNLQAAGTNIKWYDTPTGGIASDPSTALLNGKIYYASQTTDICESETRTAVKVIIDENVIIDAPGITNRQNFCGSATLADIATDGNPNIIWYDAPLNGNQLPLTTPLVDGNLYFAALSVGGSCVSDQRTEVEVSIKDSLPDAPYFKLRQHYSQHFCKGAILENIVVPNNQILWYTSSTGGSSLVAAGTILEGRDYYAAQKTGECESEGRSRVTIILDAPPAPIAPEVQAVCSGVGTLADLTVTGGGIVWYATATSTERLPLTTPLVENVTYYAAQSSGDCEGARTPVTVTFDCYTVTGTVFPFVNEADPDFNKLFPVTVKLYPVPPADDNDPIVKLQSSTPVHSVLATYYNGTVDVPAPKNPGALNLENNPGLPIDWSQIGKTQGTGDNTPLSGLGDMPTSPIGLFRIVGVAEGDYILEISRKGYLTRWGKVTINADTYLGHREILPGNVDGSLHINVNGDLRIDERDVSRLNARRAMIGTTKYNPAYDLNADGQVDGYDISTILSKWYATVLIYEEISDWINNY